MPKAPASAVFHETKREGRNAKMYCAISGEVPQQPVVSRKTGHLFERRLIEKALQASENRCPVTGEELKPEDLLPVACDLAQRPRPLSATSLPAMLAMFQPVRQANFKRPSIVECVSRRIT